MKQGSGQTEVTGKKKKWLIPVAVVASIVVVLAVAYLILLVVMAKKEVGTDEGFPDWGLTLSTKNVTPSGLTLVCTRKGGNPTGELMCGDEYHLIVLDDGTWKDVPAVITNYGWNSMAYWVYEEKDTEFEIDWEWLYGKLAAGTYRLTKGFMDFQEAGDYDTAKYWVEFVIEE